MPDDLAAGYFRTWLSGSEEYVCSPDPPPPESAKPFVVRVRGKGVIPLNVLVFAVDIEHARRRVVLALEECCEKDYRGPQGEDHRTWLSLGQQYKLVERLKSGEYWMEAAPFDINMMSGIQWASNGGL